MWHSICKKINGIPFNGAVQYYDEVNKLYHIIYMGVNEKDLKQKELNKLINERRRLGGSRRSIS